MTESLGRIGGTLLWLVIIVAIALGAAGIVAGMDRPPTVAAPGASGGTGGDGGVTLEFPGDAEVTKALDAATTDLAALTERVDDLGTQARAALAALNGSDTAASADAISQGDAIVLDIAQRTAQLRATLAAVPYVGTPTATLDVRDSLLERHAALVDALDSASGLDVDWARLSIGALAATRMSGYLGEHDRLMGEAAKKGRVAKYDQAIELIGEAGKQLDAAVAEREELKKTVDVTVLDEWIARNQAYDVALRDLYTAIKKVGNKVTNATRKAVKAEAAARARLPPDNRALIIIIGDIGRSGMNDAVIDIEEARSRLNDALADASADPSSDPSDAPESTPGATTGP
jgi:hypothetical protein